MPLLRAASSELSCASSQAMHVSRVTPWRVVVAAAYAAGQMPLSRDEIAAAWAAPSFLRCSNLLRSWARARCRVSNASMASFNVCVAACAARAEASLASSTGRCAAATSAATTSGGTNRIRAIAFGCPGPFCGLRQPRCFFASVFTGR